ncbi:MAG: hypothetical protein L7S56_06685 [Candidatus Poseidonia sp.]|nr:hypothetical protein [Poseidonia sp.]
MSGRLGGRLSALGLVTLFLFSLAPLTPSSLEPVEDLDEMMVIDPSTPLGQTTGLTIGSWPDGASERVSLTVPDGHAIQSLEVDVDPQPLQQSVGHAWNSSSDFKLDSVYDGMDVNGSELQLLPQGWEWGFETTNHGWTLGSPSWLHGYDTSLGPTGGVYNGTSGIYTYNGNYPNGMSSTIWATSPIMDCSGCSGGWDLKFMKRLGVESSSWDHAYVAVKSTTGSWTTVWQNSGSVNDGSFVQQSISITNYISGNSNFQVRFGIGTTDSSVTYTGWNIDDVRVMPAAGGVSSGEGNWTSQAFGPSLLGRGEDRMYGFMHMDATVDPSSIFEWQLIDASTSAPVPGFEHMTATSVDLGIIDWEAHPMVRIQLHLKQAQGGGATVIRSISFDGHISKTFDTDPTGDGWIIQSGSWSNGIISSSGDVSSEIYHLRSGFSGIKTMNQFTGSGLFQMSLDGSSTWIDLDPSSVKSFDQPHFSAQFRMTSLGGTYNWDTFEVELIRTSVVRGLRFDVGLDGTSEWALNQPGMGSFGLQHEFVDGASWVMSTTSPSSNAAVEVALPLSGVNFFQFAVSAPSAIITSPYMAMSVNGQDILNRGLSNIEDLQFITLDATDVSTLNGALLQASQSAGTSSLPMALVEIRIGSSLSTGDLLIGGVFASYDPSLSLSFSANDGLVLGLNHGLSSIVPVSGSKELPLPVRMDGTGAIGLTIVDFETRASVDPVSIEVHNVTNTLVPGNQWIESEATFDFSGLDVTDAYTHARASNWDVEFNLEGQTQSSSLRCPITSLPVTPLSINACTNSGVSLVWFDDGSSGSVSVLGAGTYLGVTHHFKLPDGWDDEPSVVLSVHLLAPTGPMLPVSATFGLGHAQGIENDIALKSWAPLTNDGIRSDADHPYLKAGETLNVEVLLGFEGTNEGTPRSGQALVRFLVDGNEYATTSVFSDGAAYFPYSVPTGRSTLELGVEVVPLRGQDVVYEVPTSISYEFDGVAPTLVSSDVETFDHRDASPSTELHFSIADRPHLPTHAKAHIWLSWVDDADGDGLFSVDETRIVNLELPSNLTVLIGDYTLDVDTSETTNGDYFLGWLEVADSAGNMMMNSGNSSSPLFHVQINTNGAPSLGATTLGWDAGETPWIHPGEFNVIQVPVWEKNGIYDLAEIHLSLASNTPQPSTITWNQSLGGCESSHAYVEIESCDLIPIQEGDLFSRNGAFVVNFTIEWGYDPDTSLVRIPHITMVDQSGQSNRFTLDRLGWKFSGEMVLDAQSIRVDFQENVNDSLGYWVQPRTVFDVSGDLVWSRTGRSVIQDMEIMMELGENSVELQVTNGSFRGALLAPLDEGTYGLTGDLVDAPNGAIYRGDGTPFVWFIVDNEKPKIVAVDQPMKNQVLTEEDWNNLQFELRLNESARIDEESLTLHWSLNEAGLGINSYVFDNGTVPLTILGERLSGDSIPVRSTLDLDDLMLPVYRTRAVELRIWVTGQDESGLQIESKFNDIDAPLRVWTLEQRVATYTISSLEMKPNSDIHQGDLVDVVAMISNVGLADGESQLVLELVESNGARTRLDARNIQVQSGEDQLYEYFWKPTRDGTMWLELSLIGGPSETSPTVRVDEPRSEGVLGSISQINSSLLIVVVVLSFSLIALLVFGLRREPESFAPQAPTSSLQAQRQAPDPQKAVQPSSSEATYGEAQVVASPGENPYQ